MADNGKYNANSQQPKTIRHQKRVIMQRKRNWAEITALVRELVPASRRYQACGAIDARSNGVAPGDIRRSPERSNSRRRSDAVERIIG
jgi:hypothetical protein